MDFPPGYQLAMTDEEIKSYWPNLSKEHFEFTSLKTISYNCLAWATGNNRNWMDMYVFQARYDLDMDTLDHSAEGYASFLQQHFGFERCDNGDFEKGMEKIALFEDNNKEWSHASRLLENGKWTSKMGRWEDIEHASLEVLQGKFYGQLKIFMKRNKPDEQQ